MWRSLSLFNYLTMFVLLWNYARKGHFANSWITARLRRKKLFRSWNRFYQVIWKSLRLKLYTGTSSPQIFSSIRKMKLKLQILALLYFPVNLIRKLIIMLDQLFICPLKHLKTIDIVIRVTFGLLESFYMNFSWGKNHGISITKILFIMLSLQFLLILLFLNRFKGA